MTDSPMRIAPVALNFALALCASLFIAQPSWAKDADFTELSLSDLMNVEISSVSKRFEPLSDAAAAVYVITSDQLRASPARNVAEALRLVPGVQVARSNAHSYAVSVRGFNSDQSDKLEVRLDGRSVYTPLFSGVFWDVLETDLEDVERIEIIRGPGATLWGANAVNGVINITTKSAQATPGGHASVSAGNEEVMGIALRQTVKLSSGSLRMAAQVQARDQANLPNGTGAHDGSRQGQVTMRGDWDGVLGGSLSVGANAYQARFEGATGDITARGQSANGHWAAPTARGERRVQASFEHYERAIPSLYGETRDTGQLELEEQASFGNHELLAGVGYRYTRDDTASRTQILFSPASRTLQTYSGFIQDRLRLSETLTLTAGSKFEKNDVSGFEAQPSMRLGWRAAADTFVWGAISRAVRTPNRLDEDIAVFCPPPVGIPGICRPGLFKIGNPELKSETVIAYEAGMRMALGRSLSADLALYHNDYKRLRGNEPGPVFVAFANSLKGISDGGELLLSWQASPDFKLSGSYSLLNLRISRTAGSHSVINPVNNNGASPRHQVNGTMVWQIDPGTQWTLQGSYASRLKGLNVPDRLALSSRIGWQLRPGFEFSLAGENLLKGEAVEFEGPVFARTAEQRSVWARAFWQWQ